MSSWHRIPAPLVVLEAYPNARMWQRDVEDGHLSVIKTIEPMDTGTGWRIHISISHRTNTNPPMPGRYPTWDEQKDAVWRFAPGVAMVSYLPAQGDPSYINIHPTTFHWWQAEQNAPREVLLPE